MSDIAKIHEPDGPSIALYIGDIATRKMRKMAQFILSKTLFDA